MNSKQKGIISEQVVIAELLKVGYNVSKPIGDNLPYDIIIDHAGRLYKVQIKTAMLSNNSIQFHVLSCRINMSKVYTTNYIGKCDLFIVYCPQNNGVYFHPVDNHKSTVGLRLSRALNNATYPVASDYVIEKMSAYLDSM